MIGRLMEWVGCCPASMFWTWVVSPICTLYVVNILLLDKAHLVVKNSGRRDPSNALERVSSSFIWAFPRYFEDYITWVPWSKDANLSTDSTNYVFGIHPHGIYCTSMLEMGNPNGGFAKLFPNISGIKLTGLVATVILKIPGVRELWRKFSSRLGFWNE
jgi:hypothetical protein